MRESWHGGMWGGNHFMFCIPFVLDTLFSCGHNWDSPGIDLVIWCGDFWVNLSQSSKIWLLLHSIGLVLFFDHPSFALTLLWIFGIQWQNDQSRLWYDLLSPCRSPILLLPLSSKQSEHSRGCMQFWILSLGTHKRLRKVDRLIPHGFKQCLTSQHQWSVIYHGSFRKILCFSSWSSSTLRYLILCT